MWFLPQPQTRNQYLQFVVVTLCILCLIPTRLVWRWEWRFPGLTESLVMKKGSPTINNTAECRYLPEALFQFGNALHDKPEKYGLRPWRLSHAGPKYPPWHFPGLSSQLLDDSFRGKRTAFLGDSTLFYMVRWMQTLLYNTTQKQQDDLVQMDLTTGNYHVNPNMDEHVGWDPATPAIVQLPDGTHVVWDGHRGDPGPEACDWSQVWDRVRQYRPTIVVFNWGLHLLHILGHGRDVPLCYVHAWLHLEEWLDTEVMPLMEELGVKLVLFKTTNLICPEHFWGDYSDGIALYERQPNTDVVTTCVRTIQRMVNHDHDPEAPPLYNHDIQRYCEKAVMDEFGVNDLNHRLLQYVQRKQRQQSNEQGDMVIATYNDHDIQSCQYSEPNDGRHFHPLNLARIRLLANMIQCLYPEE